jgi:MFS superfamily sulfate permease-like transporter
MRLGVVVNYLSHPVIIGFSNAAALIIASSQLSKLFGVYVDKAEHHYETIIRVIETARLYSHLPTLIMGSSALVIMLIAKKIAPRLSSVLAVVVITILVSLALGFESKPWPPGPVQGWTPTRN